VQQAANSRFFCVLTFPTREAAATMQHFPNRKKETEVKNSMSEEKPSSEANITPPANEEPTMLESSTESTSNRPTGLIIVGFIVAAILILGGIYLALRGNVATDNTADSGRTETTDVTTGETFIPGEIALQIDDSASSVTISRLTGSEFMASADWAAAVSAMPASRTLAGNVYLLN
jgi:hypothetical protein